MINAEITNETNMINSCPKCGEYFLRQDDVISHLVLKHADIVGQEVKREDSELLQIIEDKINMGFVF